MTPAKWIKAIAVGAIVLVIAFGLAVGPVASLIRLLFGGDTGI